MAIYNLAPGFYSCKWQFTELPSAESTDFTLEPGQQWHTLGHQSGQRLVKAVAEFYQDRPSEFLVTHAMGGTYKWRVQKVVGYSVIAWHCNGECTALWFRPMRHFDVNLAIEKTYVDYRLLVTNAETRELLTVVDSLDTKYNVWHEVLKVVDEHLLSRDLVTDMEHAYDYIRYIYKGRKIRANQALLMDEFNNYGIQQKAAPSKDGKNSKKKPATSKKPASVSLAKKSTKARSKK